MTDQETITRINAMLDQQEKELNQAIADQIEVTGAETVESIPHCSEGIFETIKEIFYED